MGNYNSSSLQAKPLQTKPITNGNYYPKNDHPDHPVGIRNNGNKPLFLGSMHTVLSPKFKDITSFATPWTIINLSTFPSLVHQKFDVAHWDIQEVVLNVEDTALTADTIPHFINILQQGAQAIDEALAANRQVLVHCYAGINRSVALLAYYLQTRERVSANHAIEYLTHVNSILRHQYTDTLSNHTYRMLLHIIYFVQCGTSCQYLYYTDNSWMTDLLRWNETYTNRLPYKPNFEEVQMMYTIVEQHELTGRSLCTFSNV